VKDVALFIARSPTSESRSKEAAVVVEQEEEEVIDDYEAPTQIAIEGETSESIQDGFHC
jgi:hypothetical protein